MMLHTPLALRIRYLATDVEDVILVRTVKDWETLRFCLPPAGRATAELISPPEGGPREGRRVHLSPHAFMDTRIRAELGAADASIRP